MKQEKNYKRITLTRTPGEWKEIKKKINDLGKGNINSYLRGQLFKLIAQLSECPLCVTPAEGDKKSIQYCVPLVIYNQLEELSKKMQKPVGTIIDEFFIVPLLLPEKVLTPYPVPSKC